MKWRWSSNIFFWVMEIGWFHSVGHKTSLSMITTEWLLENVWVESTLLLGNLGEIWESSIFRGSSWSIWHFHTWSLTSTNKCLSHNTCLIVPDCHFSQNVIIYVEELFTLCCTTYHFILLLTNFLRKIWLRKIQSCS